MTKSVHQLHKEAMVVDTHCDTPLRLADEHADLGVRGTEGHNDFVRMKEGGVDVSFYAIYTSGKLTPDESTRRALQLIALTRDAIDANPDKVGFATTVRRARELKAQGRGAIMFGMENGSPIQNDMSLLHEFYRLGIRYITLSHAFNNQICDSCAPKEKVWHGLSPFGKQVVAEMNQLGIMVDCSHISDESFYDCLKYSKAPFVATHSCCRALSNHPRNMTDKMIKDLAHAGGVIQINFYPAFISKEYADQFWDLADIYEDTQKAYWKSGKKGKKEVAAFRLAEKNILKIKRPTVKDLVDHIDHVVNLVGTDHVGLGSDFDGIETTPVGLEDVSKMENITKELVARGYTETDIKNILGENLLRVLTQVEDLAYTF